MTESIFLKLLHRRLSQTSVGASAIRNQGGAGLIQALRYYFENKIDLAEFITSLPNEQAFSQFLDVHTLYVLALFPKKAQSWGAARKGLNLFFRDVVYSKFFSDHFGIPTDFYEFNEYIKQLEVPLDKNVAFGIIKDSTENVPHWISIRSLSPELSNRYQELAKAIADKKRIARANLDLIYWRSS